MQLSLEDDARSRVSPPLGDDIAFGQPRVDLSASLGRAYEIRMQAPLEQSFMKSVFHGVIAAKK